MNCDSKAAGWTRNSLRVLALILLTGCTSFDKKLDGWIGYPISRYSGAADGIPPESQRLLEEVSLPNPAGEKIYTFRISPRANCRVRWTVDESGIMRKWEHTGSDCKGFTN
jgi:hypothetical protein